MGHFLVGSAGSRPGGSPSLVLVFILCVLGVLCGLKYALEFAAASPCASECLPAGCIRVAPAIIALNHADLSKTHS